MREKKYNAFLSLNEDQPVTVCIFDSEDDEENIPIEDFLDFSIDGISVYQATRYLNHFSKFCTQLSEYIQEGLEDDSN